MRSSAFGGTIEIMPSTVVENAIQEGRPSLNLFTGTEVSRLRACTLYVMRTVFAPRAWGSARDDGRCCYTHHDLCGMF
jgi:hypothetical protein